MPLSILYFGLPIGALYLHAQGVHARAMCIGHRDVPGLRRLRNTLGRQGDLILMRPDLERPRVQALLKACKPDVILSYFWPRRIPPAILDLAPRGAFGTHPSLLPTLRGPDPYFWAILNGNQETGVTLHRLAPRYDTGPIVAKRRCHIQADDTAWSLARRLDRPALELLAECATLLESGASLTGVPQDETQASDAPEPEPHLLRIDWKQPSVFIDRLIRAAAPHPGATALLGHTLVTVLSVDFTETYPRALAPGEAYLCEGHVVVRTGSAALRLELVCDIEEGNLLRGPDIAHLLV